MDNVIEFNAIPACSVHETACWLCQRGVSLRAMFCQNCGSIQSVRAIDHFARLGLERRIDIESDVLDRQYLAFKKTLAPERFVLRGLGERGHAAKQMEAVEMAYQTLRDPLKRGRYWLALHERELDDEVPATNPMVDELQRELEAASAASQCDRIAQKAGNAMEQGVMGLMQALRAQNWTLAGAILREVEGLERILNDVRDRRSDLAAASASGAEPWPCLAPENV